MNNPFNLTLPTSVFDKAVLRLTIWYLAAIMLLSVAFSVALYNVSTRELRDFQDHQEQRQQDLLRSDIPAPFRDQVLQIGRERLDQVEEGKHRIAWSLAYFNLVILFTGGAIGYVLAKRTLQPIEEAVEAQNRFTADASHELRTPLTAIRSELEVALRDKSLGIEESKRLHESTLEEVGRIEALTKGLLRLARQDFKSIRDTFQESSLQEVVDDSIAKVSAEAKNRSVEISQEITGATLVCDKWSLSELLTILLDNAVKYGAQPGTVTVKAEVLGHMAVIKVADKGSGIPSSDLPHLFDRFWRADSSRTKGVSEGYGLGLSIAKQIVDVHRGTIKVESVQGLGTVFTVRIPIDQKPS